MGGNILAEGRGNLLFGQPSHHCRFSGEMLIFLCGGTFFAQTLSPGGLGTADSALSPLWGAGSTHMTRTFHLPSDMTQVGAVTFNPSNGTLRKETSLSARIKASRIWAWSCWWPCCHLVEKTCLHTKPTKKKTDPRNKTIPQNSIIWIPGKCYACLNLPWTCQ